MTSETPRPRCGVLDNPCVRTFGPPKSNHFFMYGWATLWLPDQDPHNQTNTHTRSTTLCLVFTFAACNQRDVKSRIICPHIPWPVVPWWHTCVPFLQPNTL